MSVASAKPGMPTQLIDPVVDVVELTQSPLEVVFSGGALTVKVVSAGGRAAPGAVVDCEITGVRDDGSVGMNRLALVADEFGMARLFHPGAGEVSLSAKQAFGGGSSQPVVESLARSSEVGSVTLMIDQIYPSSLDIAVVSNSSGRALMPFAVRLRGTSGAADGFLRYYNFQELDTPAAIENIPSGTYSVSLRKPNSGVPSPFDPRQVAELEVQVRPGSNAVSIPVQEMRAMVIAVQGLRGGLTARAQMSTDGIEWLSFGRLVELEGASFTEYFNFPRDGEFGVSGLTIDPILVRLIDDQSKELLSDPVAIPEWNGTTDHVSFSLK